MVDSLWGSEGSSPNWCRLQGIETKDVVNLVCEIACNQHDTGATLVLVHPSNFFARIEGLKGLSDGTHTVTLTDLKYVGLRRLHTFQVTDATVVKQHSRVEFRDFSTLTELCCGMGVASQGFQHVGIRTVLACDMNPHFVAAFQHVHPEVPIVQGDVNQQDTIRKVLHASDRPTMTFAGFNCQPFSRGGAKLGADDARSASLHGVLEMCYLLRSPIIILECVPDASTNRHVRNELSVYCHQCSYHLSEIHLSQEQVWPCKRDRWWAVLTASSLGSVPLKPFPHTVYPSCVKHVLPKCWNMPAEEWIQLVLSPEEHARFVQYRPDLTVEPAQVSPADEETPVPSSASASGDNDIARHEWIHCGPDQSFTVVAPPDFVPSVVRLQNPEATVGQLVAAEVGLSPVTNFVEVLDPASGAAFAHDCRLQGLCVMICCDSSSDVEAPEMPAFRQSDSHPPHSICTVSPTLKFDVEPVIPDDDEFYLASENCPWPPPKRQRVEKPLEIPPVSVLPVHPEESPPQDISPKRVEPEFVPLPFPDLAGDRNLALMPVDAASSSAIVSPVGGASQDPLLSLTDRQLVALVNPVVASWPILKSMLKPSMSLADRLTVLQHQGMAWADDEIRWHIDQIISKADKPGIVILDPHIAAECLAGRGDRLLYDWVQSFDSTPTLILSAVCFHGHWTPFAWQCSPECLQANSWDFPPQSSASGSFNALHDKLAKALGSRTYVVRVLHRTIALKEGCGICAIRYLDYYVRGKMLPTTDCEVLELNAVGKDMFIRSLQASAVVPRPWAWGFGLDPQAAERLHSLLGQHGVPKSQCEQRAFLVQQAVGIPALQKALVGTAPWRSIKALCNQVTPPMQLVLPDELKESLQHKANAKGRDAKKKVAGNKNSGAPTKPPPLDPSKLMFDEGAFVSDDGRSLPQLTVAQLGPLVEGVALATLGEIEQFLRGNSPMAKTNVAVFVLNADEAMMTTRLPWTQCRVALRCVANHEPMLLQGFLVQLGTQFVQQGKARHEVQVADVGASCVKIAIYRDALVGNWDDFISAPVKYLFKKLELLVPCPGHDDPKACPHWHPTDACQVRDPVFDVWRRQWLTLSMQQCPPAQASIFMVNIRFAKVLEPMLLTLSGTNGIYMEPRSLDSKNAVLDYQVIWLPRKTLQEVLHIRQTNPTIIGLARLGSRLGVRVKAEDAPGLSSALRPDTVMLAGGPRLDFELGPLLYGLDRNGVATLCRSWGWHAKPVNPSRSLAGEWGTVWLVQACTDPPASVFSLKGNDVVVTKVVKTAVAPVLAAQPAVASPATLSLCALSAKPDQSAVDPWVHADPWGYDASKLSINKAASKEVVTSLHQFEESLDAKIEKAVLAKLPKHVAEMEVDESDHPGTTHQDARLEALESQVSRLMSGHQVLEQRIEDQGRRSEAHISQVQHQMSAQLEAQSNRMEDLFQSQMSRLESLLTKKARME